MKRIICVLVVCVTLCLAFGATAFAADEKSARLGIIMGDNVCLRAKASTESERIGTLNKGDDVLIIGSLGKFFKVIAGKKIGYVSDQFTVVRSFKAGVSTTDDLILREGPSTSADKLGAIDKGDSVNIYNTSGDYYYVVAGETKCYVAKKYISTSGTSKAQTVENDTTGQDSEFDPNTTAFYTDKPGSYTDEELYLAAQLIYAEGKNQSEVSLQAMASVLFNRVASSRYPDTIEENVFKKNQFSVVNDREKFLALEPSKRAKEAIQKVFVEGQVILPADVMYFKSARLSKSWGSRKYYATIGGNMYYS